MMTRDKMIREYRARTGTWQAFVIVYAILMGTMVLTASAIV